jgi:anti-sigma B factor antagonist
MDGHGPAVLRVTVEPGPEMVSLRLTGELDVATAGHLAEAIESLPGDHLGQVRLDLGGLTFVDASGLTALLQVKSLVGARGGRLSLHRPRPMVLRLLEVTDLTGTFDVDPESSLSIDR